MRKKALADILFWLLACVSAVMLTALLLVLGGVIELEPTQQDTGPARTAAAAPEPEPPAATTTAPTETTTEPAPSTAPKTPPKPPPPKTTVVVVTAARGDSWFSARVGSENGRVLDERVLAQGDSVELEAERIWLTVGAAGNVELTVNGKPRPISPGTVSLVLTPPGADESS
jgi:cytoskeletal protein RodZ